MSSVPWQQSTWMNDWDTCHCTVDLIHEHISIFPENKTTDEDNRPKIKRRATKVVELLKSQFVATVYSHISFPYFSQSFLVQLMLSYVLVFCATAVAVTSCMSLPLLYSVHLFASFSQKLVEIWKGLRKSFRTVIICVHCFALNSLYFLPLNGFRRNMHINAWTYMYVRFIHNIFGEWCSKEDGISNAGAYTQHSHSHMHTAHSTVKKQHKKLAS